MAKSTGVILAVGGITLVNDTVLNSQPFTFKIPIATGIAALLFAGLEHAIGEVAVAMAYLALVAVSFTRVNPAVPSPAESLLKFLGHQKGP